MSLLVVALAASSLHAKRFTDAEKKLNAIQSHNLSVEKWKKLYSLKPAAEQQAKPQQQKPSATVTDTEKNVNSGVKQQALKPSPPKAQFDEQQQPLQNKPAPVITKDPKEEKQKKERYFCFNALRIMIVLKYSLT